MKEESDNRQKCGKAESKLEINTTKPDSTATQYTLSAMTYTNMLLLLPRSAAAMAAAAYI